MEVKYFSFRQTKSEPVHHQQICNEINITRGCSGRRKMIPDRNLHLHKEKMTNRDNKNYVDKYKMYFYSFYFSWKANWQFRTK